MKKILAAIFVLLAATAAHAEVAYDYKNPDHKADMRCVGVVSFARDFLYSDVQINKDGTVQLYTVEDTADLQQARRALGDLSNSLMLRYEYSKQFNTHYRAWKGMVKIRFQEQGSEYLRTALETCKKRI